MSTTRGRAWALAALLAFTIPAALAASKILVESDIKAMTRASDLVVLAQVVKNEAAWSGGHIVTRSEVEVLEVLAGTPVKGQTVVEFLGGTVGYINEHVEHVATLRQGEVAVLFLRQAERLGGRPGRSLQIVGEHGRLSLLHPGQDLTHLSHNAELKSRLSQLRRQISGGGQ